MTQLGWFNIQTFNVAEYTRLSQLKNGDMNWIIPGKFLAFSCPSRRCAILRSSSTDEEDTTLAYYTRVFKRLGVQMVIRLNNELYNSSVFTNEGILHEDLFFRDGTCPSRWVIICN